MSYEQIQVQRYVASTPEMCGIVYSDAEGYLVCVDGGGQKFIAKQRLGAWSEVPLSHVVHELAHCDKIKRGALSDMASEARRLNLK